MPSHKRKYCTNNKSKKLLTIMNTKLDLIQKSLDDLHKEHVATGLTDSSSTLDSDSSASMYQSDVNSPVSDSSTTTESPVSETESPVSETESPVSETENPVSETESPVSETENPVSETENPVSETENPSSESQTIDASSKGELYSDGTSRELSDDSGNATASSVSQPVSDASTPSWMNESPKEFYGERQPYTPPGGYGLTPTPSSDETKKGGKRRIRKTNRQQRQYLRNRNKSRNRRM